MSLLKSILLGPEALRTPPAPEEPALTQALALLERPVTDEDLAAKKQAEIDRLRQLQGSLLPVEKAAGQELASKISDLIFEQQALEFAAASGLPRISLEPLAWAYESGMPKLVPFHIEYGWVRWEKPWHRSSISVEPGGRFDRAGIYEPSWKGIQEAFNERARQLKGEKDISLSVEFSGILPVETRTKIKEHKEKHYPADIYIVAEVAQDAWKWQQTARPRIDPLVVDYRCGYMWLIDVFDTTSLEDYVATEFSST